MVIAAAVAVASVVSLFRDDGVADFPVPLFAGIAAAVAVVVSAAVFAVRRRRPGAATFMVAATAGLLAATPVHIRWDDGCNIHAARAAVVAAPVIERRAPETTPLDYGGVQTTVGCAVTMS